MMYFMVLFAVIILEYIFLTKIDIFKVGPNDKILTLPYQSSFGLEVLIMWTSFFVPLAVGLITVWFADWLEHRHRK